MILEPISMQWGTRRFRVLDTLARTIGESHSLRSFADQVKSNHGTGHYPNVHDQLERLARDDIVSFHKAGRSKVPRLRFDRTGFADEMATLELWRKRQLLEARPTAAEPLDQLETSLAEADSVLSVCLAEPDRNLRLRRLEPLVLIQDTDPEAPCSDEGALAERLAELQAETSLRIDPWIVPARGYGERLRAREANPAPRFLHTETCLWHPQAFWRTVAEALPHGEGLAPETPARLASLAQPALAWNLTRWGYEERGRELDDQATRLCPEAATVGALAADVPRWTGAAGVVLAKADIEPALLVYLAKAEDEGERLGGIVEVLHEREPDPQLAQTLGLLEAFEIEPEPIEHDMVLDAVELYGG